MHTFSVHVQEHKVRILNKLFHALSKPCTSRTIDYSMIRTYAKVNRFCFLDSETIWLGVIVDQLRDPVGLSDRDYGSLRS